MDISPAPPHNHTTRRRHYFSSEFHNSFGRLSTMSCDRKIENDRLEKDKIKIKKSEDSSKGDLIVDFVTDLPKGNMSDNIENLNSKPSGVFILRHFFMKKRRQRRREESNLTHDGLTENRPKRFDEEKNSRNRRNSTHSNSNEAFSVQVAPRKNISNHDYDTVWVTEGDIQEIIEEGMTSDDQSINSKTISSRTLPVPQ